MTDASTRRRRLALVALVAVAAGAFLGGGYTFGLLTDQESTDASIRAASDFGESDPDVAFRGCGEVRFGAPGREPFAVAVTVYRGATGTRETVALTANGTASDAAGLRYRPKRDRYAFDLRDRERDRILGVRLGGEYVENEHRCAENAADGADAAGARPASTTAGNDAPAGTPANGSAGGVGEPGDGTTTRGTVAGTAENGTTTARATDTETSRTTATETTTATGMEATETETTTAATGAS